MIDRERILGKIDELEGYLRELEEIKPKSYEEYADSKEKKRACERLLHISIECVMDICSMIVSGLRLGIPGDEKDMLDELESKGVFPESLVKKLRGMRGFRNVLVHRYNHIDDELVFEVLEKRMKDFRDFIIRVKRIVKKHERVQ